jgi:hypothetical protein
VNSIQKIEPETSALVEQSPAGILNPMALLDRAISQGAGLEVISKFMDLQERWEKGLARKAFDAAVSAAKAEIPVIIKNATGHNNKQYADFAAIARVVDPILGKHGLSYRFRTKQDERIHVTCILSHRDGHSEETTLVGPPDASGSKNAIQAIGSTLTYLQRYSLVQALGLAAAQDDDGKTAGAGLTDEQAEKLKKLTADFDTDAMAALLKYVGADGLDTITAANYDRAIYAIGIRKGKAKGEKE